MPYTSSSVAVTDAIKALLDADIAAPSPTLTVNGLTLAATYYGNEGLIPTYPAALVESDTKDRDVVGTRQFEPTLRTSVTLIWGKVQSTEINTRDSEVLTELVEDLLHQDFTLGGLVYFGYVARISPGTVVRPGVLYRGTRLLWVGRSREAF